MNQLLAPEPPARFTGARSIERYARTYTGTPASDEVILMTFATNHIPMHEDLAHSDPRICQFLADIKRQDAAAAADAAASGRPYGYCDDHETEDF